LARFDAFWRVLAEWVHQVKNLPIQLKISELRMKNSSFLGLFK
jgi:hypothetical protein